MLTHAPGFTDTNNLISFLQMGAGLEMLVECGVYCIDRDCWIYIQNWKERDFHALAG